MFIRQIIEPFLNCIKHFGGNNVFFIKEKFYSYTDFAEHVSKIRTALQSAKSTGTNIGLVANDDVETYASIFALRLEGCLRYRAFFKEKLIRT